MVGWFCFLSRGCGCESCLFLLSLPTYPMSHLASPVHKQNSLFLSLSCAHYCEQAAQKCLLQHQKKKFWVQCHEQLQKMCSSLLCCQEKASTVLTGNSGSTVVTYHKVRQFVLSLTLLKSHWLFHVSIQHSTFYTTSLIYDTY